MSGCKCKILFWTENSNRQMPYQFIPFLYFTASIVLIVLFVYTPLSGVPIVWRNYILQDCLLFFSVSIKGFIPSHSIFLSSNGVLVTR